MMPDPFTKSAVRGQRPKASDHNDLVEFSTIGIVAGPGLLAQRIGNQILLKLANPNAPRIAGATGATGATGSTGATGATGDDAWVSAANKTALDALLPLTPPKWGYAEDTERAYKLQGGVWMPSDFLLEGS